MAPLSPAYCRPLFPIPPPFFLKNGGNGGKWGKRGNLGGTGKNGEMGGDGEKWAVNGKWAIHDDDPAAQLQDY